MTRRALCILAAMAASVHAPALASPPAVGTPAPDFTLRLLGGEEVTLDQLRGQVVVLNYWATWCVPCRKELPLLDAFYLATRQHGLRVFAITTEDSVPLNRMKKLTGVLSISVVKSMRGDYGILKGVPTNYVIDRAGVVRYAKAGAWELDDLNAILIPLLQERPAALQLDRPSAQAQKPIP